jgi:ABC-type uncharacterized transport system fused permease/ATPase subunit
VLDEATSALDEKSRDKMMEMVTRELPKATVVSVAHRAELEAFTAARSCWSGARAAQSSSATSISFRATANEDCSADSCGAAGQ